MDHPLETNEIITCQKLGSCRHTAISQIKLSMLERLLEVISVISLNFPSKKFELKDTSVFEIK
jgi:hypothetical protein